MADDDKPDGGEETSISDSEAGGDTPLSVSELVEQLKGRGLHLGDGVTADNFLERLHVALSTADQMDGKNGEEEPLEPEQKPVEMMAHANQAATKLALENCDLRSQVNAIRSQLAATERRAKLAKLHDLVATGRATKSEIDLQRKALEAVALSLDANGTFTKHPVDYFVESRESLPAGTLFPETSRIQMLGLRPEFPDPELIGKQELDGADLEQFLSRNGYGK